MKEDDEEVLRQVAAVDDEVAVAVKNLQSDEKGVMVMQAVIDEHARRKKLRYAADHPEEARELEEVERETAELVSDFQRALSPVLSCEETPNAKSTSLASEEASLYAERVQCRVVEVVLRRNRALSHFLSWSMRDFPPIRFISG